MFRTWLSYCVCLGWLSVSTRKLKGVSVITIHRGDQKQRFKIGKISRESARDFNFENKEGGQMSVETYFKDHLNVNLRFPTMPLAVKSNGRTAFPLECLKIAPAQRFMKRLSGDQTADMIRATVQRPADRQKMIQDAADRILRYEKNDHMKSFGLEIGTKMMSVPARILPATQGGVQGCIVFESTEFLRLFYSILFYLLLEWIQLVSAPLLESAAFIFFVRVSDGEGKAIAASLLNKFTQAGMNIKLKDPPVIVTNPNVPSNVRGSLQSAFKEAMAKYKKRCQIIFCVLDKDPKGLYETIKRTTLTEAAVLTQCMLFKHVRYADDIKDQYAANLSLKANIKLGGATNYLRVHGRLRLLLLFSTVDKNASVYHTYIRAQGVRVEVIQDMENIVGEALDSYHKSLKVYPASHFFFRDGVANSQFEEVVVWKVCPDPTIYNVIHDDNGLSSDAIQQLCYNFVFLAQRATRSIAMVSPAYRAHIAAYYARMFIEGEFSDTASQSSTGSGDSRITFKNVPEAIQRTMYYM
ncbi:hypothetical protein BASA83_006710 [Batrachochytrium salamandrivorans]|nr:hypothetical protein BASA83_006710 [Batrachochytrium salamandrivorans]